MKNKTPIQKAIDMCPDEAPLMKNYLQSLLKEETEMVEKTYNKGRDDGIAVALNAAPEYDSAFDYFIKNYNNHDTTRP